MKEKFLNTPNDSDTRIISNKEMIIKDVDALLQTWIFDGIKGQSLIFVTAEVESFSDAILKELPMVANLITEKDSSITLSRKPNAAYVFVNFNFETML